MVADGVLPGATVNGLSLAYAGVGFARQGTVNFVRVTNGRYDSNSDQAGSMTLNYLRTNATVTETGGDRGVIGWQRDENVRVESRNRNNQRAVTEARANLSWHTIWGAPATNLPTTGLINFDLIGATQATQSNAQGGLGTFNGRMAVNFGTLKIGLDATVDFGGTRYAFASTGGVASPSLDLFQSFSGRVFEANLPTTANGTALTGGTDVQGFLAGRGASHAGLTYSIRVASTNAIEGAAAFAARAGLPAAAAPSAAMPADWSRWTAGVASTGAAPAASDPASASSWSAPVVSAFEGISDHADRADAIRKAEAMLGGIITFPAATLSER